MAEEKTLADHEKEWREAGHKKPWCCFPECEAEAEWFLTFGHNHGDCYDSCSSHLGEFLELLVVDGKRYFAVMPVTGLE